MNDVIDVVRDVGADAPALTWESARRDEARAALADVITDGRPQVGAARGRWWAGLGVAGFAAVLAVLAFFGVGRTGPPASSERPSASLPRGGTEVLPAFRVVAHYGSPGGRLLGILGQGGPEQAAARLERAAAAYGSAERPVLPALELIATIVRDTPQRDGRYRSRLSDDAIQDYLVAARQHQMLLILNIQPGRARFMDEVRHYERWLREPDVGLALDPEWSMGPGEIPGKVIGQTDASTVNQVSAYLAALVRRNRLPQKLLLVHQFTESMVRDSQNVHQRRGVATVFTVDGFGTPEAKVGKYRDLTSDRRRPKRAGYGFKLFFEEDIRNGSRLMTPAEVLALDPQPDVIVYE